MLRGLSLLLMGMFTLTVSSGEPADALVTFYSNGSLWSVDAPVAKHAAFIGALYDGKERIGFVAPKHFVTLRLPPGKHTFSASYSVRRPDDRSQVELDLAEGGRYFMRVQETHVQILYAGTGKNLLNLVDCQTAQDEAGKFSPTREKGITAKLRGQIAPGATIPSCQ